MINVIKKASGYKKPKIPNHYTKYALNEIYTYYKSNNLKNVEKYKIDKPMFKNILKSLFNNIFKEMIYNYLEFKIKNIGLIQILQKTKYKFDKKGELVCVKKINWEEYNKTGELTYFDNTVTNNKYYKIAWFKNKNFKAIKTGMRFRSSKWVRKEMKNAILNNKITYNIRTKL